MSLARRDFLLLLRPFASDIGRADAIEIAKRQPVGFENGFRPTRHLVTPFGLLDSAFVAAPADAELACCK